jgi:Na+/H+ antiporter NhaB
LPSKVGVDDIVITSPEQSVVPAGEAIVSVGVPNGNTDMVMLLLVAVAGLGHSSFEVMSHVTTSPFTNALDVYVLLFVPTLLPLTFHW